MARIIRLLLVAGGLVVIAVLVRRVGGSTIVGLLRTVRWRFLVVSAVYAVHVAMRAGALWRSMPGTRLAYREVLAVRLAGEAVEMLTFTGPFLAEPAKGFLLKRRGLSGPEAFGAVAVEYLLYTLVSAWLATVSLAVLLVRGVLPSALTWPVRIVLAGMLAFSAGFIYAARSGTGLIAPSVCALRAVSMAARVDAIEGIVIGFMHDRPLRLAEVLAIELAGHALLAAEVWIVLTGLGFRLAPFDPLLIEGGVKFISVAFFFVPGQVGAQEGVYALLVRALGLPAAAGVTFALVRRVRALIVATVGVAVLAWAGGGSDGE